MENFRVNQKTKVVTVYSKSIDKFEFEKVERYKKLGYEITMLEISGSNVTASTDNYKINMSIDAVDYDGGSRLLLKQFDYLKNLK